MNVVFQDEGNGADLLSERIKLRGDIERILAILEEREKLLNERFSGQESSLRLALEQSRLESITELAELQRRLGDLNHAHQIAREKDAEFISRESYDTFVARTTDDFDVLRREIRVTADAASAAREGAALALAAALLKQDETNGQRFGKIERFQFMLTGGLLLCTFIVPLLTALAVYMLTRHAIPTSGK